MTRKRVNRRDGPPPLQSSPLLAIGAGESSARPGDNHQGRGAALLAQLARRVDAARRVSPLLHNVRRDPAAPSERACCRERP